MPFNPMHDRHLPVTSLRSGDGHEVLSDVYCLPVQISLFRPADHAAIVGDAFVTVQQESLYKVFTQRRELSGPPRYFTEDWDAAKCSVQRLADRAPSIAMTGHGMAMAGAELRDSLHDLVARFEELAAPD